MSRAGAHTARTGSMQTTATLVSVCAKRSL